MDGPVYHLKPNKAVDRNLFVESLVKMSRIIDFSKYRYIGFGSYEFDEFKMIYRALGIEDLHSIEMESEVFKRQAFNKPYSCIQLFNKSCGTYFDEDYDETKHSIIWVDFSKANDKYAQCQDISNICGRIHEGDILRITFNANSAGISLGDKNDSETPPNEKKKLRYAWLKKHLGDYFPEDSSPEDITKNNYPLFLLKVIKKAVYQDLRSDLFACPICSYVYSDSTQMMTILILIELLGEKERLLNRLQEVYKGWGQFIGLNIWNNPLQINLPALTVHEQLEIRQYGCTKDDIENIKERMGINEDDIKRYLLYARYYPNYQPVII